jgi:hypothetical protein
MKRLLVLVVTAALAVGLYAATAGGMQQAVTPGQFAALSKKVAALQKQVNVLKVDIHCISPVGVASFGNGTTFGYHFKQSDTSEILTSALDTISSGETAQFQMATIDPSCVSALRFHSSH